MREKQNKKEIKIKIKRMKMYVEKCLFFIILLNLLLIFRRKR